MLDGLLGQIRLGEERPRRLDLGATVKSVLEFLEPQRRRIRIEIAWDPPQDPLFVDIEPDEIRHALIHLLVMAIEVTAEGQTLGVQVAARGDCATIRIEGSAALGVVMREGSEEEDEARRLTGGARGLEVARRVVERHRGTIHVRSSASRATTVEIELPRSAAEDK